MLVDVSGYDFAPVTPPESSTHLIDAASGPYIAEGPLDFQDLQERIARREELLPLLQESPQLLSFPGEQAYADALFSPEERGYLTKSFVDTNSPSILFPNSSSPSIPLSACLPSSPIFAHTPEAEPGLHTPVLTTEIPPLGRKLPERQQRSPSLPAALLLQPVSAPNSTLNPSMGDNRVSDRPHSVHRHTSMSTSSTPLPHGSVLSHYHTLDNRPQSPSFARRSLARHGRIRSRSSSPYEASSDAHNHPRRSSSRSIPDFHSQTPEGSPILAHTRGGYRTSPGNVFASRSPPSSSSLPKYRLRAASFDSPPLKTTAPTSVVRGSYNPDDESSDDVEMDPVPYVPNLGAEGSRRRSVSISSSSTSSSNSPPSPPPRPSARHATGGHKSQASRSYYDHNPMMIDAKEDEAGPSTDEGESGSEPDEDYKASRHSSYTRPLSHYLPSSSYPNHPPRCHSHSPSRPAAPADNYRYRVTAVAPSDVSPSPSAASSSRKGRRLSHSPVRHSQAYATKAEDFTDDNLFHKRASPARTMENVLSRKAASRDFDTDDEGSAFDDDDGDDDYCDSAGSYRTVGRPVKQPPLPRRGSNAHLATKPMYGSPLKGSILPTDSFSDAAPSAATKPRSTAARGRPRSGSAVLPYPSPRASVASSSIVDSDASSVGHLTKKYRDVGTKNIDIASEKRRKGEKRFQCCFKDCNKMFTTNQNRQSESSSWTRLDYPNSDFLASPSVEAYRGEAISVQVRIRLCEPLRPPAPFEQEEDCQPSV